MTNKVKRKKGHRTAIIFWVCLILVVAPFAILGWILFSAAQDTHVPVLGNRYQGDLDPAITSEQLAQVKTDVEGVLGVEKVDVQLATATLRVYADVTDTKDKKDTKATAKDVYNKVAAVLDPNVYFTRTDTKKMYDLEVHVYTLPERANEDDNFVYVICTKTSNMSEPKSQVVSSPLDKKLAQKLRDDVEKRKAEAENPAPAEETNEEGGEIVVGGEDVENGEQPETQE